MNLESGIRKLCARYGIRPSKKLGQNFLVDAEVTRRMIEAAELNAEDYVVEIGPGFGMLTVEMAKIVKKVVAVEVDARLARALEEIVYSEAGPPSLRRPGLQILHGDILKISNEKLVEILRGGERRGYKVVASLPYSITSAVLRKFTELGPPLGGGAPPPSGGRPTLIVVLVQKEVAERVCAKPGEMSVLSVAVQYYGRPEIVGYVPRSAFWPVPEVDSAILRITPSQFSPYLKGEKIVDEKRLFQMVRIGFSSRRKQLQNNLMAGLRLSREKVIEALRSVGLQPTVRAQELSVKDWIALSKNL